MGQFLRLTLVIRLLLVACAESNSLNTATFAEDARNIVVEEALPLRINGRFVVDARGRHVQLACVNWYGAHQRQRVMNGLDEQPLYVIAASIVHLGFNCVRLPFSLDMVFPPTSGKKMWNDSEIDSTMQRVPDADKVLRANPDLKGLSPIEIFDRCVYALTTVGLLVVLNQHVSSAGWCCSGSDGEGFWYTQKFPEASWLAGLEIMTKRYRSNPRVVGFDLRNEVRPSGISIPTWGTQDPTTDWALAAVRGGKRVVAANPDMIIIVSGIMYGVRLVDVKSTPIHVLEPELRNRTVYSTHYYYGWCFDLVARDLLLKRYAHVVLLTVWFWAVTLADELRDFMQSRDGQRGYGTLSTLSDVELHNDETDISNQEHKCFVQAPLAAALLLLLLTFVFLLAGYLLESRCGHIHIVSPPAFAVLADIALRLSCVFWVWVLLPYTVLLMVAARLWFYGAQKATSAQSGRFACDWEICADGSPCSAVRMFFSRQLGWRAWKTLLRPLRARRRAAALAALVVIVLLNVLDSHFGAYESFAQDLDVCWGFLLHGDGVEAAPVWLSEFGTEELDVYWSHLVRYMRDNELDFAYWSINGEKEHNVREPYGILGSDSTTVQNPRLLTMLQSTILKPLGKI